MVRTRAALALLFISSFSSVASAAAPTPVPAWLHAEPYRPSTAWLQTTPLEWLRRSPYQVDWDNPYLVRALAKPVGLCPAHDAQGKVVGYTTVSLLDLWHYLQFDYLNLGLDAEIELRSGSWHYDPATFDAEGMAARQAMEAIRLGPRKHNGAAALRITLRDPLDGLVYHDLRLQLSVNRDSAARWPGGGATPEAMEARSPWLLTWDPASASGYALALKETIQFPHPREYPTPDGTATRHGIRYTTSNHWFSPSSLLGLLRIRGGALERKADLPRRAQALDSASPAEGMLCSMAQIEASTPISAMSEVADWIVGARQILYAEPETFRYLR